MTTTRTIRPRRPLLAGTTAVAALAVTAGLVAATPGPAKARHLQLQGRPLGREVGAAVAQTVYEGGRARSRPLPEGTVKNFSAEAVGVGETESLRQPVGEPQKSSGRIRVLTGVHHFHRVVVGEALAQLLDAVATCDQGT